MTWSLKVSQDILITITISLILIAFLNLLLCDDMASTSTPAQEITFFSFIFQVTVLVFR